MLAQVVAAVAAAGCRAVGPDSGVSVLR